MMTDDELKRLAHFIVLEQASNETFINALAKATIALNKTEKLVTLKEAANIIGKSASWLYKHKEEDGIKNFSFVKSEDSKNSSVMFNASTLMEEYNSYVLRKKSVIKTIPLRKVM